MSKRILTPEDRQQHIDDYRQKNPSLDRPFLGDIANSHFERIGDLAAVNSNQFHNPKTGFKQFYTDTPDWIVEIAQKRGWIEK